MTKLQRVGLWLTTYKNSAKVYFCLSYFFLLYFVYQNNCFFIFYDIFSHRKISLSSDLQRSLTPEENTTETKQLLKTTSSHLNFKVWLFYWICCKMQEFIDLIKWFVEYLICIGELHLKHFLKLQKCQSSDKISFTV